MKYLLVITTLLIFFHNSGITQHLLEGENIVKKPFSIGEIISINVGKEGEVMERVAKELADKYKNSNTKKLFFEFFEGNNHANVLHLAVYNAFNNIFNSTEDTSK